MENGIQGWRYILGIFHAAGIKLKLRLASWGKWNRGLTWILWKCDKSAVWSYEFKKIKF